MDRIERLIAYGFVALGIGACAGTVIVRFADSSAAHPGGGDIATWFGAAGTIAAFIGTIRIAGQETRRREREQADLARLFAPTMQMKLAYVRAVVSQAIIKLRDPMNQHANFQIVYAQEHFSPLTLWTVDEVRPLIDLPDNCAVNLVLVKEMVLIVQKTLGNGGKFTPAADTILQLEQCLQHADAAQFSIDNFFTAGK